MYTAPENSKAHRVCTVTTLDRNLNISTYTTATKIIQNSMSIYNKFTIAMV